MYNGPLFADGWTPQQKTFLEIFLHLFPLEFFTNVIVEGTSSALVRVDSARTTIGEMLQYVGMLNHHEVARLLLAIRATDDNDT